MSTNIFLEAARLAREGQLGAVASVVRRRGSLPMSSTAKLLVTAGGARAGTVGGGCLEAEIMDRALDVMQTREPAVSKHTLNAHLAGDYGLTCGGTATVFIEPVYADEILLSAYNAAATAIGLAGTGAMLTGRDWREGVVKAFVAGRDCGGAAPERMIAAARRTLTAGLEAPVFARDYIVEPVNADPPLVVFGGGHVGASIARVAAQSGWRVTIVDDREEFADAARHSFAERTVCCDFHDVGAVFPFTRSTYVVVATRGHQHDALIVDQLARRDLRYIGMLGSRRKVALTWKLLEGWGVPPDRLARVHAPIGLSIGADTPAEIAVSVVAEIIAVRRRKPVESPLCSRPTHKRRTRT